MQEFSKKYLDILTAFTLLDCLDEHKKVDYNSVPGLTKHSPIIRLPNKRTVSVSQLNKEVGSIFCELDDIGRKLILANRAGNQKEFSRWFWKYMADNPEDYKSGLRIMAERSLFWFLASEGCWDLMCEHMSARYADWQTAFATADVETMDRLLSIEIPKMIDLKKNAPGGIPPTTRRLSDSETPVYDIDKKFGNT